MSARDKKLVYHLTAVENLTGVLRSGLKSRRELLAGTTRFTDVADVSILSGRAEHGLDAYVPFHFIQRSPFDYAVVHSRPESHFALIAVSRTVAQAHGWSIIPRHPLTNAEAPELLPWHKGVESIEWNEMDKEPRNYSADHHCKMVCMAEALSPATVPVALFQSIFLPTSESEALVRQMATGAGCSCYININPNMFPKGTR
jgi:hypothetical protein